MWFGNALIDPTKGKRAVSLPDDPKGRRDLFDVLHARNPGVCVWGGGAGGGGLRGGAEEVIGEEGPLSGDARKEPG